MSSSGVLVTNGDVRRMWTLTLQSVGRALGPGGRGRAAADETRRGQLIAVESLYLYALDYHAPLALVRMSDCIQRGKSDARPLVPNTSTKRLTQVANASAAVHHVERLSELVKAARRRVGRRPPLRSVTQIFARQTASV